MANGFDVPGLVGNVGDVDVDENQTDFSQFRFQRMLNLFQKLVTVAVDVFNRHGRDNLSQLTEDDVFRLLFDFPEGQAEKSNRCVLHQVVGRSDGDRKHAGDVDADVFQRQRAAQRNFNLHRFQRQPGVVLNKRLDESRAAGNADRRLALFRLTVNDKNPVAGASFIAFQKQNKQPEKQQNNQPDKNRRIKHR